MLDPIYLSFRESEIIKETKKEKILPIQVLISPEKFGEEYFSNGGSIAEIQVLYQQQMQKMNFIMNPELQTTLIDHFQQCVELSTTNKSLWIRFLEWLGLNSRPNKRAMGKDLFNLAHLLRVEFKLDEMD